MNLLYTLHWKDTGIVIQSGQVPRADLYPLIPDGAMITEGVEADPETERIDGGKAIPWVRPLERDELMAAIERERAKRLAKGFDYDFKDKRGVHRIGTTESDESGWSKVTNLVNAYMMAGKQNEKITLETDTGEVVISAKEWSDILIQKGSFEQQIYAVSFKLQKLDPIPQDVENPKYWKTG